jgi:FdhD protein
MSQDGGVLQVNASEISLDGSQDLQVSVPVERSLVIEVNGRPVASLMSLPGMERELAVGFCLSEGLVSSFGDVLLAQYCHDEAFLDAEHVQGAVVRLQVRPEGLRESPQSVRRVRSGCGSVELNLETLALPVLPLESVTSFSPQAIWDMARALRGMRGAYRRSGAVHGAGLFAQDGTTQALAEDIGRHNAVDKVLGAALIRGLLLERSALLATGRAGHEVVAKALRLHVPLVGTLSAPTSLAIELATEGRCTVIGRLRRERFIVYTWPERIGCCESP